MGDEHPPCDSQEALRRSQDKTISIPLFTVDGTFFDDYLSAWESLLRSCWPLPLPQQGDPHIGSPRNHVPLPIPSV